MLVGAVWGLPQDFWDYCKRVQALGLRVSGWDLGFRTQGLGLRVSGLRCRVAGLRFRVWGVGLLLFIRFKVSQGLEYGAG